MPFSEWFWLHATPCAVRYVLLEIHCHCCCCHSVYMLTRTWADLCITKGCTKGDKDSWMAYFNDSRPCIWIVMNSSWQSALFHLSLLFQSVLFCVPLYLSLGSHWLFRNMHFVLWITYWFCKSVLSKNRAKHKVYKVKSVSQGLSLIMLVVWLISIYIYI